MKNNIITVQLGPCRQFFEQKIHISQTVKFHARNTLNPTIIVRNVERTFIKIMELYFLIMERSKFNTTDSVKS